MDPKGGQILDPKLKEAYDRVMGASIPQAAPQPPPPPSTATPPHAENLKPAEHQAAPAPHPMAPAPAQPAIHTPPPPNHPPAAHTPATAAAPSGTQPHASMSFSTGYVAPHAEKKSSVSGSLLIFAGVIFLVVYTLFWMKWFGMTIPFLP